ncbi:MAG TPA: L-aspartate oxidase [Bryobacteraceae bacterium]|jgi:L-aspartate oxidase|nr:L-aspartate oxidase [Bryobacteraceae bacterium]
MNPDFLVIGAGVAGMRAAIELSAAGQVLVVAKESLRESSSEYAQGGIAVALGDDDEVELHEQDTLMAGDGLCDQAAVHALVEGGPAAIEQLIAWGAAFDREHGVLAFTREGAHSRNRILHAHGDSTGREIAQTLYRRAASLPNITFRSYAATLDLVAGDGVCGALLWDGRSHTVETVRPRAVLLATGGLGNVYRNTTNPEVATGDGVAMAYRAGAEIGDLEFVQFHPTALHVEGAPRFLVSEALRGEGARLLNAHGERFMERYHPMGELAPRDVVARAIVAEMERTGATSVALDLSHREPGFVSARFPRIYQTCLRYGIDLERQPAPVAPAAHYAMGGVCTDLDGRTNLPRLFAAGEAACTGVHGANRLASNSLLEGVVFGARAGRAMLAWMDAGWPAAGAAPESAGSTLSVDEIRGLAWEHCGIIRDAAGLRTACSALEDGGRGTASPASAVAANMREVVLLIARCALARQESRGAHFRRDFPQKETAFQRHSVVRRETEVAFR